ncbi:hypothetical protein ABZ806_06820 [Spirillospora sp. NPDC047418]
MYWKGDLVRRTPAGLLEYAGRAGGRRIVAYIVPATGDAPGPDLAVRLRRYAARRLPSYMVPSAYALLPEFPLTPNGKLDRAGGRARHPAARRLHPPDRRSPRRRPRRSRGRAARARRGPADPRGRRPAPAVLPSTGRRPGLAVLRADPAPARRPAGRSTGSRRTASWTPASRCPPPSRRPPATT